MNFELLKSFLTCHATPFDESEVSQLLSLEWKNAGLKVKSLGQYAILAEGNISPEKPTLLFTAHMDSPGFTADKITQKEINFIRLGYAHFEQKATPIMIKTNKGKIKAFIQTKDRNNYTVSNQKFINRLLKLHRPRYQLNHGDRACYISNPQIHDGIITSPFLDNRIGCFLLAELAPLALQKDLPFNIIFGATAGEEINGFGAKILAQTCQPNIAICLDATYCDDQQKVFLGKGPVLTLSDASVILSPKIRDNFKTFFAEYHLPLQTEVYNYSGTDAKAFPTIGLTTVVIALLLPSTGNHTPYEKVAITDIESLYKALNLLASQGKDLFNSFSLPIN